MTGLVFSDTPVNETLQSYGRDLLPTTLGESVAATMSDPILRPTAMIDQQRRIQEAEGLYMDPAGAGMVPGPEGPIPLELESPDVLNERYGDLGLKFEVPTNPRAAEIMAENKRAEQMRESIIARGPQGALPAITRFGAAVLSAATDPINVASAFIPVVGEARFAGIAARIGRTGAFATRGAIEGAVGNALVEPITYGLSQKQQLDYEMSDALLNVAIGSVLGGGLQAGIGRIGDYIRSRSAEVNEAAIRKAVADAAEARIIDVEDALTAGSARKLDEIDDIPAVVVARDADTIADHPRTRAALNGSEKAAREVIDDVAPAIDVPITPPDYRVAPVRMPGQLRNKFPDAMASKIADEAKGEVAPDFKITRKGDDLKVEGDVERGKAYVLTAEGDDAQRGVAALTEHIKAGGGDVVGVIQATERGARDPGAPPPRERLDPFANVGPEGPQKISESTKSDIDEIARKTAAKDLDPENDITADFDAKRQAEAEAEQYGDFIDEDDAVATEMAYIETMRNAGMLTKTEESLLRQATTEMQAAGRYGNAARAAAACLTRPS